MDDTVQNSQATWAGKDAEPMDSMEERLFFLKGKLSTLQSENESMRASVNELLKEKVAMKKHNLVLADMITNLNGYITQLRSLPHSDVSAIIQPIATNPHREQKIPDPPRFLMTGQKLEHGSWICASS